MPRQANDIEPDQNQNHLINLYRCFSERQRELNDRKTETDYGTDIETQRDDEYDSFLLFVTDGMQKQVFVDRSPRVTIRVSQS